MFQNNHIINERNSLRNQDFIDKLEFINIVSL
jgi:hypothetical protein